MSSSIRCKIAALGAALVGSFAGCTKSTVDLYLRPCEDGQCAAGYVCNRQNGDICVLPAGVPSPSAVSDGDPCTSYGSFIPCEDGAAGCEQGCRTCQPDNTWGDCRTTACKIGSVTGCATCEDDCTKKVKNATPICRQKGNLFTCDYSGNCAPGFRDADGGRGNGCECAPECSGRCAGSDGCGGTCPNNCTSPESCGGGGVTSVCGCTPQCSGKCSGDDLCGGVCPDTCVLPQTCGGGATKSVCGCTPQCGSKCSGPDACGSTCPNTCVAPTTCGGGGVADECGRWWSCGYARRYQLRVQSLGAAIPAGYSMSFTFNHSAWVASGISLAGGTDVRVVYWNGSSWLELDRAPDPDAGWNATNTTVWFKLQAPLAADEVSTAYYVYVSNSAAGAPPADETKVFRFADFFDRAADSTDINAGFAGTPWDFDEYSDLTDLWIINYALCFAKTNDYYNRPYAQHDFAPLTGKLVWRFATNWFREGGELYYRVWMQLGDSSSMSAPDPGGAWPVAGVGPDLLWGSDDNGVTNNKFYPYDGTSFTRDDSLQFNNKATLPVSIRAVVDLTASPKTYDLTITGQSAFGSHGNLSFADPNNVAKIDRVRFVPDQVSGDLWSGGNFSGRSFNWVLVRELIVPEPGVGVSATAESKPSGCL